MVRWTDLNCFRSNQAESQVDGIFVVLRRPSQCHCHALALHKYDRILANQLTNLLPTLSRGR
jgi:hypothetical protein